MRAGRYYRTYSCCDHASDEGCTAEDDTKTWKVYENRTLGDNDNKEIIEAEDKAYGNCQEQLRTFEVVDYECPWCWPIMETLEGGNAGRNDTVGTHYSQFKTTEPPSEPTNYGKIFKTNGWSVYMEASCTGVYTDPGARCYDHTDGILEGMNISAESDIINEKRPAKCEDNNAPENIDDQYFTPTGREMYCNQTFGVDTGNYRIKYTSKQDGTRGVMDTTHTRYSNLSDLVPNGQSDTDYTFRGEQRCHNHSSVKSYLKKDTSSYTEQYHESEESYLNAQRYIHIRDFTQPEIYMGKILETNQNCSAGGTHCTVEAGYAFRDEPPTAYDDLCRDDNCCCDMSGSGEHGRTVIASGDAQVMMAAQYQSFHSCQDIYLATKKLNSRKQLIAPFQIGEHDITLVGENTDGTSGSETLRKAWCDNTTTSGNYSTWIIPHGSTCPDGSKKTTSSSGYQSAYNELGSSKLYRLKDAYDQGKVLCYVEQKNGGDRKPQDHPVDVSHAFAGQYVFTYNVKDCAGNPAVTTYRFVTVQDTLPPVIQLKLFNELIQQSSYRSYVNKSDDQPIGHNSTPGHEFDLQRLGDGADWMEESPVSSINGWIVGVIAAAATGIALVAYSRFTSVKTIEV